MPTPYSSLAVANEFIALFGQEKGIEHMKLQKLVYCAYGWWLSSHGLDYPRLTSKGPEIWKHGPVFDGLYQVLKVFGRKPICEPQSSEPFMEPERFSEKEGEEHVLIRWIWGRYGHLSSFALSDLTHQPGSPWHRIAVENDFRVAFSTEIPDDYIFEEFSTLMGGRRLDGQNRGEMNEREVRAYF